MNFDYERFLNTGSIMLTLYAIAVLLLYIAFFRTSETPIASKSK